MRKDTEPFEATKKKTGPSSVSLMSFVSLAVLCLTSFAAGQSTPTIVVDTVKGTFEIETYPSDAPKTVAHVIDLVKSGFYDGQRIHRALPGFVVQWGDPQRSLQFLRSHQSYRHIKRMVLELEGRHKDAAALR